jgi:hypothetical protein
MDGNVIGFIRVFFMDTSPWDMLWFTPPLKIRHQTNGISEASAAVAALPPSKRSMDDIMVM